MSCACAGRASYLAPHNPCIYRFVAILWHPCRPDRHPYASGRRGFRGSRLWALTIRSSRPHVVASAMCFTLRLHTSAAPPRGGLTQALGPMKDISQIVEELTQLDVGFYCTHPTYGGQATISLSPQNLLLYVQDPVSYLASYYKISKADYLAWHQSGYSVLCAGKTRAGKPCKNVVESGSGVEPRRWLELQGSFCHVHQ